MCLSHYFSALYPLTWPLGHLPSDDTCDTYCFRGCSCDKRNYWRSVSLSHNAIRLHYSYVIMGDISSQVTSLAIVHSTVYSGTNQRKHQSSASLAFVRGNHRRPVNSPHKWPATRKIFPFDDVVLNNVHLDMVLSKTLQCKFTMLYNSNEQHIYICG